MDLTIVLLIIPPNLWPHFINWYRAGHLVPLLLGKNKQAITLTEALPLLKNTSMYPTHREAKKELKGQGVKPRKLH